jgi:hypothetical protein
MENNITTLFKASDLRNRWINACNSPLFKVRIIFVLLTLALIGFFIGSFFNYIQGRQGFKMNDVLVSSFSPLDVSVYIFICIYSVILITLLTLCFHPSLLLLGLTAYAILILARIVCLYLIPLEPLPTMILLKDPFVKYFFYNEIIITKDLFFSGHVSTLCLLAILNPVKVFRYAFILITFFTAILILLQHVHYTIDVLAAPFFAWGSYKAAGFFHQTGGK